MPSPLFERTKELFPLADASWRADWLCFLDGEFCRSESELLASVARRRGCGSVRETAAFYSEDCSTPAALAELPSYRAARDRLRRALFASERVLIFSDYDADGITAMVILVDVLRRAGADLALYVPDRLAEGYGLTLKAAQAAFERHRPSVVVALDCGTNSTEAIEWLRQRHIGVIVLDHHRLDGDEAAGAVLVNPTVLGDFAGDLTGLTAAGLAFCFAEQMVQDFRVRDWDRRRAITLAGIGTFVDVGVLTGVNRILVKAALTALNDREWLSSHPGLAALATHESVAPHDERSLGYVIGPLLNAPGRVSHAHDVVRCLLSSEQNRAKNLVAGIAETNAVRRQLQEATRRKADQVASQMMNCAIPPKVIVIAEADFHPGVVGIVASRIREKFGRPTFVLGAAGEGEFTGSGRSCPGFSMGKAVGAAVATGVALAGGGHDMAAGVRVSEGRIPEFVTAMEDYARGWEPQAGLRFEILGVADARPAAAWLKLLEKLGPFGNGNPRPKLIIECAVVVGPVNELRTGSGKPWALRAMVETTRGKKLLLTWPDVAAAKAHFIPGARSQFVVDLFSASTPGLSRAEWVVAAGAGVT